jgi:RNA polymerase sigma-70 factor (ECF subfamily)
MFKEVSPLTKSALKPTDGAVARLVAARPRLLRLARLRGAPESQQEDIVQETLLTAWRALDRLRDPERFDAWLDGILRNICRHAVTRSGFAPHSQLDDLDDADTPTDDSDPLNDLTQREVMELIDAALGHLRQSARQALELRYLAELPAEEIAARLGVTLNTLDARLSRARRQLRATLSGPLRTQAIELGLALGPADEAGWRDSRIWCRFCGRARMRGILEDNDNGEGARLVMRCPICYEKTGAVDTNIQSEPTLRGLTSFRAANKRILRRAQAAIPYLGHPNPTTPCMDCGAPVRGRIIGQKGPIPEYEITRQYPEHFFVVFECPHCGLNTSSAAGVVASKAPEITRFILQTQRLIFEPEALAAYESAPAIRFSLLDHATGARMTYYSDPVTLDLRGYERRP